MTETFVMAQNIVSQMTRTMDIQSRVFPSVTDIWPFQDHIQSESIILTQALSPGNLNNECAELSLPHCHQ